MLTIRENQGPYEMKSIRVDQMVAKTRQQVRMFYGSDLSAREKKSPSPLTAVRLILVLLPAILLAGTFHALAVPQEPPGAPTQAPIARQDAARDSDIRVAYVAVMDKKRAPISDLKYEDFSVRENGVPQQLVDVSLASESPLVVGVMVDVSGSTAVEQSRHERLNVLLGFLASSVGSNREAYITAFGMSSLRLTGITNNPAELQAGLKQVDNAHPYGGTALFDSLITVVSTMPPELPGRKILLVMSDFEENSSHHRLDETILRAQQTGTTIFALVEPGDHPRFSRKPNRGSKLAQRFAEESGGEAYLIESPKDMEIALQHLQLLLKNSYAVKYHASAQPKKDGSVPLKIDVHRKDATLIATQQRPPALP
jgi:VWFA-related protein